VTHETFVSVFADELGQIRFHCPNPRCDCVLEMSIAAAIRCPIFTCNKHCPACDAGLYLPDLLVDFCKALERLHTHRGSGRVEFRLKEACGIKQD